MIFVMMRHGLNVGPMTILQLIVAPFGTEVQLCTRANFKGDCVSMFVEHDTCTSFPDGFHNSVSSLSLVQGWECTLFKYVD